jgi:hypothetical protein
MTRDCFVPLLLDDTASTASITALEGSFSNKSSYDTIVKLVVVVVVVFVVAVDIDVHPRPCFVIAANEDDDDDDDDDGVNALT